MTTRRAFLRAMTTTAAGLLIADDALESLVEPRRKLWPGWRPEAPTYQPINMHELDILLREYFGAHIRVSLQQQAALPVEWFVR